jgi:hypothetical protein
VLAVIAVPSVTVKRIVARMARRRLQAGRALNFLNSDWTMAMA